MTRKNRDPQPVQPIIKEARVRKTTLHLCPECGAVAGSDPIGTPLRCTRCPWRLVSRSEWIAAPPFDQGWLFYMQSSWPTSEIAKEKNPYPKDTPAHAAFQRGEQRATQHAQDGEE